MTNWRYPRLNRSDFLNWHGSSVSWVEVESSDRNPNSSTIPAMNSISGLIPEAAEIVSCARPGKKLSARRRTFPSSPIWTPAMVKQIERAALPLPTPSPVANVTPGADHHVGRACGPRGSDSKL